jgi:ribose 5-phosphate isomerase A
MSHTLSGPERAKFTAAKLATDYVKSGMKVGLGTGSTAAWLVKQLGAMVTEGGLDIVAVPTSSRTAELAIDLGIRIITLDEAGWLDVTIDGADEFDRDFNLIKGGGGALLREKIVAQASHKMIVIADKEKDVATLGNFALPIEVIPFGLKSTQTLIEAKLKDHGFKALNIQLREKNGLVFITDEGNHILDTRLVRIANPRDLAVDLNRIPGVVENGLFVDICETVVIGYENGKGEVRTLLDGKTETATMQDDKNIFSVIGQ